MRLASSSSSRAGQPADQNQHLRQQVQEMYDKMRGQFPEVRVIAYLPSPQTLPAPSHGKRSMLCLQVKDISASELYALLQSPEAARLVLVDTRTDDELAVSRIPKAISKATFAQQKQDHRDRLVIAYWYALLSLLEYCSCL